MSGLDISGARLSLTCRCGAKVGFNLAQAAQEAVLVCPSCGTNIHLRDNNDSAKQAIINTDKAVSDLQRSIANINRQLRH